MSLNDFPGTHSIQNVSVYSPLPGEIEVNGCLIHGSNGVGALVIVYSSRRVYYSFSTPQAPNQCVVVAKVSGLAKGHYQVSLFMVEEGGRQSLFTGLDHWTGLLDWNTGLTFDPKNSTQKALFSLL